MERRIAPHLGAWTLAFGIGLVVLGGVGLAPAWPTADAVSNLSLTGHREPSPEIRTGRPFTTEVTASPSLTATAGASPTATQTVSPTLTSPTTPTVTVSQTTTATQPATATQTVTATPSLAPTASPSASGTPTSAPTATLTTATPPTSTPSLTRTLTPSLTAISPSPQWTATVSGTLTPDQTWTPVDSATLTATAQSTDTPEDTLQFVYLPYLALRVDASPPKPRQWGVQLSLESLPEVYLETVPRDLEHAKNYGMSGIRSNIRWDQIEPTNTTPDEYDWTVTDIRMNDYADFGFDVIATVVGYPAWATRFQCGAGLHPGMDREWRQFVRALAERYSRPPYRVALWEIGNEVDSETIVRDEDWERPEDWGRGQPTTPYGGCWGDMAPEYVQFLRIAYEEIMAVDPDALVSYGGLALQPWEDRFHLDFMDRFLEAGGGKYYHIDNYHWFAHLSRIAGQPQGPEKHQWLQDALARHGETGRPVWLTETYQLTVDAQPELDVLQVDFLTQDLVEMLALPDIERVYWYGWVDMPPYIGDGNLIGRGLIRHDHVPKAAARILPFTIEFTNGVPHDESTDRVWATRWSWPRSGPDKWILWSHDGEPAEYSIPERRGKVARVRWFPPDAVMAGDCCPEGFVSAVAGSYRLTVGTDPLFVDFVSP